MQDLIISLLALLGGFLSAWLSDRCINAVEGDRSLFESVNCAACERRWEIWDRIPLLSWMLNGGKCRFCGAVQSKREPLITFCTIAVWLLGLRLWMPRSAAYALIHAVNGSVLLCAAGLCWIRASERPVLMPLLLCTGAAGILIPDDLSLISHLLGAGGLLIFSLLLRYLPEWIRGREKLRADTMLYLSLTGLMIGWRSSFFLLPAAVITGALFMLIGRKKQVKPAAGKEMKSDPAEVPRNRTNISFCLTCAAVLTLLFGKPLMNWYLSVFARIG